MHPRLRSAARLATALGCACAWVAASAQPVPPPPRLTAAPTGPASAPAAAKGVTASAYARAASAPAAHVRVIEDDDIRIEETRGPRGQLQRVTVHIKGAGGKPYEIILPPGGKDASQARGAAGQRAWSVFDF